MLLIKVEIFSSIYKGVRLKSTPYKVLIYYIIDFFYFFFKSSGFNKTLFLSIGLEICFIISSPNIIEASS